MKAKEKLLLSEMMGIYKKSVVQLKCNYFLHANLTLIISLVSDYYQAMLFTFQCIDKHPFIWPILLLKASTYFVIPIRFYTYSERQLLHNKRFD